MSGLADGHNAEVRRLTSVGFSRLFELFAEVLHLRELGRDGLFQEVQEVLTI